MDAEPDADDNDASEPDPLDAEPDAGDESDAEPLDAEEPDADLEGGEACDGSRCACEADDACANDQYCSQLAGGHCVPRCDAEGQCAGPQMEIGQLETDGRRVFISTSQTVDAQGDVSRPGLIWVWDLESEPATIVSGLRYPMLYFVAGDYLYYADAENDPQTNTGRDAAFERWALSGTEAPERLADHAHTAWATQTQVFWSVVLGADAALWRMPIAGAAPPERSLTGAHAGWVIGNDAVALRHEERYPDDVYGWYIVADSLSQPDQHVDIDGPVGPPWGPALIVDDALYAQTPWRSSMFATVMRIDLNVPGERTIINSVQRPASRFRRQGDHFFWASVSPILPDRTSACAYQSTTLNRDLVTTSIRTVYQSVSCAFVVIGTKLIFFYDSHLFTYEFAL